MDLSQNGILCNIFNGIDMNLVKEENRSFSMYPKLPLSSVKASGVNDVWLELTHFIIEDLRWLLSLEHHKFLSYMIFSEEASKLVISILRDSPPNYARNSCLFNEEIRHTFEEIEKLVFLIFVRLTTAEESKHCFFKNLDKINTDTYLFTAPVLLDFCLFYGFNNSELVKKIIEKIDCITPNFLDSLQTIVPHFFHVLKLLEDQFQTEDAPRLLDGMNLCHNEIISLVLFLYDSVATIQLFLDSFSKCCKLFCTGDFIKEIASFYSNVLPEIQVSLDRVTSSTSFNLIGDIRVDFLKIIKSIFDYVRTEALRVINKRDEFIDEYLTMMMELLSEPTFLCDYNRLYPVGEEIKSLIRISSNIDTIKVNHILCGLTQSEHGAPGTNETTNNDLAGEQCEEVSPDEISLMSLVTEVKEILPHLNEAFIRKSLKRHNYDSEKVIAAALDESTPSVDLPNIEKFVKGNFSLHHEISSTGKSYNADKFLREKKTRKERKKLDFWPNNEMVEKEKYARWFLVADEIYNDEYDDTYEGDTDVALREEDDIARGRRPFVVPRILRQTQEYQDNEEQEDDDDYDDDGDDDDDDRDNDDDSEDAEKQEESLREFSKKSLEVKESKEQRKRDVVGIGRGKGQSKNVQRNRNYKETHKSFIGNHNRKKQSNKKRNQGII